MIKMDRYCLKCNKKLEDDEKELCARCEFYELKDDFEPGNIG